MILSTLQVQEKGTFYKLVDLIEEDKKWVRMLPDSIARIKKLKEDMDMLENIMEAEAQAHKEARRHWARNIVQRKLVCL